MATRVKTRLLLKSSISPSGTASIATVNFSVPDAIKQAFNETFKDQNKSAIIAELMCERRGIEVPAAAH
jgi:hypothetical protein